MVVGLRDAFNGAPILGVESSGVYETLVATAPVNTLFCYIFREILATGHCYRVVCYSVVDFCNSRLSV